MPTLKAHCSAATKARFHALAKAEGMSESTLLRRMAVTIISGQDGARTALPASEMRGDQGGRGSRVMLRLRPTEVQAIRALAEPEGYSAQAQIVRQLRYRLEGAVPFAKHELSAQHDAIRELSAVGRRHDLTGALVGISPHGLVEPSTKASIQHSPFLTRKVKPAELFGRVAGKLRMNWYQLSSTSLSCTRLFLFVFSSAC